jgi:ribonuclease P protein subunit RPR2
MDTFIYLVDTSRFEMKDRKRISKKPFNVDMATQRIERLFRMAGEVCGRRPDLADRYVDIARRISMRHRVSIPRELKRHVCKECYCYLAPGINARVRVDGRNVLITCQRCGGIRRYPYKK